MIFPEGALNNSENRLCMPLFPGIYHFANETGVKTVPIVAHSEPGSKKIYIKAGAPMDFSGKDKKFLQKYEKKDCKNVTNMV